LEKKINENDELALKLESSLSNQEAEKDAYMVNKCSSVNVIAQPS